jgi:PPOX class probable F420-dependent enzyme
MPARIPEAAFHLFDGRNFAHLVTLMGDGSPQVSPVWVGRDGDHTVVVNTAKGRVKHRNILGDPRVALSIHDQDNPYEYVQVRGRATLSDEDALAHADELARRYFGRDFPTRDEERVIIRITPDAVDHHG